MFIIICLLVGFLAAFVGSIAGLGGGVILVPSLLILNEFNDSFSWATSHAVVGISLFVMVFTAASSTITYLKGKRIDYKSGFLFIIASIPGGIFGSWLNQFIGTTTFSMYFGILMILLFVMFFVKERMPMPVKKTNGKWSITQSTNLNGHTYTYSFSTVKAFTIAFVVGTLSGLFGIGGGSLMVPAMILLFQFPAHVATATSMFMIFFLSIISSATHITLGHVQWEYVWLFIPGAWVGGTVGAKVNQRLNGKTVEWILRGLLVVIGIRLIWQGIG